MGGNKDFKKIPMFLINNRPYMQPIENVYEILIIYNKAENQLLR